MSNRPLTHRSFVRRSLGLEQLQQRNMLAGNVSAFMDRGTLIVNGDIGDNELRITNVGKNLVQLTTMSSPTTINNQLSVATFHVTKGMIFNMGGGNDVLQFDGVTMKQKKDLVVDMGRGDDNLQFNGMNVVRIRAVLGEGHDSATVTNSKVERSLNIFGAGGDEQITLANSRFGEKSVLDGNGGANFINQSNVKFGRKLQMFNLSFGTRPAITPPATTPIDVNDDNVSADEAEVNAEFNVIANDTPSGGATFDLTSLTITQAPQHGQADFNNDGTLVYTHNGSETISDTIKYSIRDSKGQTAIGTVNITINPANDAPVAVNDNNNNQIGVGGVKKFDVASNDTDSDGNSTINKASITITGAPAVGTAVANSDGTITYTHTGADTTTQTIKYTIKDATGATSNEATLTISIVSNNAAPDAVDDAQTVAEGATNVLIDVLANDTDAQGNSTIDATTLEIVSQPAHGTAVAENGKIKYTNNGTEFATDTITYRVRDNLGALSDVATVNITVTLDDEDPVATGETVSAVRNETTVINVSSNDVDPENQLDLTSIDIVSDPTHGTATPTADGKVTYVNNGNAATTDSFTYNIKDAAGNVSNTVTVNITVTGPNTAPVAGNDPQTVNEGAAATVSVLSNDDDPDTNDTLDVTTVTIVTPPANGTAVPQSNGTILYTHDGSETTTDTFTYTVKDNHGLVSNAATVTITITPVNDAPVGVADPASVTEDSGTDATGNVLTNDTDPDGPSKTVSAVNGVAGNVGTDVAGTFGTFHINADGTFTYELDDANTTVNALNDGEELTDSMAYTVSDGTLTSTATLTVTINGNTDGAGNEAPVAVDDIANVDEGGSMNINVADNDTDDNNDLDLDSIIVVQPAHGTVVVNGDGSVTYTHDGSETTEDSFVYTIKDGDGVVSNSATVTLTIAPFNDAPNADDDGGAASEGGSATIDLAANDEDGDVGGSINVGSIAIVDQPDHGTFDINGDGTVTYHHDGGESTTDTFTYTINDNNGTVSNIATVTITISPENDAPTALGDVADVDEGASVIIPVSSNDTDPENQLDPNSIEITEQPLHGTLTVHNDGTVTYEHDGTESISDSFEYTIKDTQGLTSAVATVTISIDPVNDAPLAENESGDVTEDSGTPATGNVLDNDSDPEGTALNVSAVDGLLANVGTDVAGQHGTFHINADGSYTYTLDETDTEVNDLDDLETLIDSIAYSITDGSLTATATLSVTIHGHTD